MNSKIAEFLERNLIKTIVLLVLIVSCLYRIDIRSLSGYNGILSNTVTVVSIFIGVLMSMMGFLLTVTGMKVVKSIVNVGVHKMILSYFLYPIMAGIIIVLLSTTMDVFIKAFSHEKQIAILISIVWSCLAIYFIVAFIRIVILMYLILIEVFNEIASKDSSNQSLVEHNPVIENYKSKDENEAEVTFNFDDPNMYE